VAFGPVKGPATPITISAWAENAVTIQPANTSEIGLLMNFSDIMMFLIKEAWVGKVERRTARPIQRQNESTMHETNSIQTTSCEWI
jgi:hypothetical protein